MKLGKIILLGLCVVITVPCLAQLSDAEIARRMAEMNKKKPVATEAAPANNEPKPPPVVKHTGPTYYLVPLRGEVGTAMIASNLEKMLADAVAFLASSAARFISGQTLIVDGARYTRLYQ